MDAQGRDRFDHVQTKYREAVRFSSRFPIFSVPGLRGGRGLAIRVLERGASRGIHERSGGRRVPRGRRRGDKMADEADSNGDASALPVGKEAVDRMIKENSHIFTDAHCKVCSAVLISESQKLAHYQSKKHANKVRRYMAIHGEEEVCSSKKIKLDTKQEGSSEEDRNKCCPICNMTFSSPVVANSHYLGKTHAKNLKLKQQPPKAEAAVPAQKQPANPPPTTVPSNEENQNTSDPDKFCSLCHATFNNPLMAKQHYVGKKHKKQETKLKLMAHYGRSPDEPAASTAGKGYPCESCNIVLNSIEQYQAHISGFKHKNHIPGGVPVTARYQKQLYTREETTGPDGYSYFSQDL
ncbi:zinc finger protein 346 isoform X2 [Lacerta agilis]|uniref:zinc finger protein 346 isoform X2 n=1 Tax=Lacerta agilis TaxID=80427 RepID=UPI001419FBE7|nr:zinc finger protein 346 isoform X2 [Lacerta agilis]